MAQGSEAGRRSGKSHARQNKKGDESGLQTRTTLWIDSAHARSQSHAICPLQNDEQLRSDDPHPTTSLCTSDETRRAGADADATCFCNRASHFRMPGLAVAGCQFRAVADSRSADLDVWRDWGAEKQGLPGTCASASAPCRIHPRVEERNTLFAADGLGVPFHAAQRQTTAYRKYAG